MDFLIHPDLAELRDQTRRFIAREIIPMENDPRQTVHGPTEGLRNDLIAKARAEGLLTPHAPRELGGMGLSHVAKAIVFEEAGYSTLGPTALNIHAPDEGNIHLMDAVATSAQKERWLMPQIAGHTRSCVSGNFTTPNRGLAAQRQASVQRGDHWDRRWTGTEMMECRGGRRGQIMT